MVAWPWLDYYTISSLEFNIWLVSGWCILLGNIDYFIYIYFCPLTKSVLCCPGWSAGLGFPLFMFLCSWYYIYHVFCYGYCIGMLSHLVGWGWPYFLLIVRLFSLGCVYFLLCLFLFLCVPFQNVSGTESACYSQGPKAVPWLRQERFPLRLLHE